jgi:hypothetical protein
MRSALCFTFVAVVTLGATDAFAQATPPASAAAPSASTAAPDPPPAASPSSSDPSDLVRLQGLLEHFGRQSRGYRTWGGLSSLAIGAAAIPSGVILLHRGNGDTEFSGALVLGLGIGTVLGGGLLLAFPFGSVNQFGRLSSSIDARQTAGQSSSEIVAAIESQWRENAESSRALRRTIGIIAVSVGTMALAGGTYLALADASNANFSRKEQYGFSAVFFGLGSVSVISGLQAFFFEEPIEAAWKTYESLRSPRSSSSQPLLRLRSVGYSPVPGGGVVGLAATF